MITHNPWIGWSSYDENLVAEGHKFVGRTNDIGKLYNLIDNNILVTLYGKSGIGKTSLLKAGVFPSLRVSGYIPVVCRANQSEHYVESIISQIKSECDINPLSNDNTFKNVVEFFNKNSFSINGEVVFPVLILDQFEDWFRINRRNVDSLLKDIAYLSSSSYDGTTNYRFVISIREDYLYLLEDAIDFNNLADLKQNRYRLTKLDKKQVEEIMHVDENVSISEEVEHRIMQLSKDGEGYFPGLVSFYCHELFSIFSDGNITNEALDILKDERALIERYYNKCFINAGISLEAKKFIENYLQDGGIRRPQNIKFVSKHISPAELSVLLTGQYKLLQKFPVGDEEHVELLHDRVAEIIQTKVNKRTELKKNSILFLWLAIYFLIMLSIVSPIITDLLDAIWAVQTGSGVDEIPNSVVYIAKNWNCGVSVDFSIWKQKLLIYSQISSFSLIILVLLYLIPRCICKLINKSLTYSNFIKTGLTLFFALIMSYGNIMGKFADNQHIIWIGACWGSIVGLLLFIPKSNRYVE